MAFVFRVTLLSLPTVLIFPQITTADLVVKPTDTENLFVDLRNFNSSTSVASAATTGSDTKPFVDAILVICLFLIPIIIVASVLGGIYLQARHKIFERLGKRKDRPIELYSVEAGLRAEEHVPLKSDDEELRKSNEEKRMKIEQLEKKTKQLEEEKRELEGRLYPTALTSYSDKPKMVNVIEIKDLKSDSKKETRPILGMTLLRNKLFLVTEKSSEIEVYDSVTLNPEPKWQIAEISNPLDIAACNTNNCLYICDDCSDKGKFILRVDSNNSPSVKWSIRGGAGQLSVTREANVVLSFFNGNKINEYSPDGELLRTVKLSPADNISHPWHAIKTTSMHFIFSHGVGDDPLQRVCVANSDGKIIKSFGGKKGSDAQHVNRPVHLLEDSSLNVLVADMKNKRVLLLSPTLECNRILLSADTSKLRFPMRLCLDEERGILFVADNNYKEKACTYDSGRILIFNCKA